MPTYEYRCKACGFEFEEFESMSSDPLVICPKCAEPSLKRLMSSGAGLLFKGSGFYLTDYKKSNTSPSSSSDSKTNSKPDTKPAPSPDAKAESKPEDKKSSGPSPGTEKK